MFNDGTLRLQLYYDCQPSRQVRAHDKFFLFREVPNGAYIAWYFGLTFRVLVFTLSNYLAVKSHTGVGTYLSETIVAHFNSRYNKCGDKANLPSPNSNLI